MRIKIPLVAVLIASSLTCGCNRLTISSGVKDYLENKYDDHFTIVEFTSTTAHDGMPILRYSVQALAVPDKNPNFRVLVQQKVDTYTDDYDILLDDYCVYEMYQKYEEMIEAEFSAKGYTASCILEVYSSSPLSNTYASSLKEYILQDTVATADEVLISVMVDMPDRNDVESRTILQDIIKEFAEKNVPADIKCRYLYVIPGSSADIMKVRTAVNTTFSSTFYQGAGAFQTVLAEVLPDTTFSYSSDLQQAARNLTNR